jgi:hypothetical protein
MKANRKIAILQLIEASRETDRTDREAEKTAVIQELLVEVEESERRWEHAG